MEAFHRLQLVVLVLLLIIQAYSDIYRLPLIFLGNFL